MTTEEHRSDEGGESACFAHLVCPECFVVIGESDHQQWCANVNPEATLHPPDSEEPSPGDYGQ